MAIPRSPQKNLNLRDFWKGPRPAWNSQLLRDNIGINNPTAKDRRSIDRAGGHHNIIASFFHVPRKSQQPRI
jgi:hypothetical protein